MYVCIPTGAASTICVHMCRLLKAMHSLWLLASGRGIPGAWKVGGDHPEGVAN